ncbi:PilZ domain-containing protein [Marinobacterium sediminicola]|uniref:PilZ domain-containing protein n=1 Tax=Marinobacterium sediminicola TaxID=518898 RepID=A0ABY1RY67_9GAMM|nr:PilZ domain-containing protein [Marinobacterium sediminicola]ULG68706.1 PilZ domain-containing protein [Marinobacterium sediminicola]SMR73231.1 hypothetical protein SAMN04487964_103172 [Marinobacterium sediminicola]
MKPKIHIPDIADSGRRAYRLQIDADAPLRAQVNGESVKVENLSATGIAFTTESLLTLQYYPSRIKFRVGKQVHRIDCTLRLIRKSGVIWCADFSGLSPRDQRLLSEFITWYQAEQIRKQNKKV